ncbi:MAG: ABC transporter permease [Dehalococcoidia bacterium]
MRRQVRFVAAYLALNFSAAMEYRAAFVSQTIGMMLNDGLMIVFWVLFFQRFPRVSGWGLRDVLALWGIVAASFGLGVGLFGNTTKLAAVIARGQLDFYLTTPKNTLLHVLVARMSTAAWGDVAFGVVAFLAAGSLSAGRVLLFVLLCITGCAVFVAYHVIVGSLAFWFGNAETLAPQASGALVNFATYPGGIFRGWVRLLTFTAIPAAMLGHVPVEQLRRPDPRTLAGIVAFANAAIAIAATMFELGLRRYQSGNLIELRG